MECPIAFYDFCAIIDQACGSGVEALDLGVQDLQPPAVLGMRLIHRDPESFAKLLRNILEEGDDV